MVDMKVQVYSKFRKNKIWKKVKSPISMRKGTFNASKNGGVVHPFSQKPWPIIQTSKKLKFKKKAQNLTSEVSTCGRRATAGLRPAAGQHLARQVLCPFF
jgi:hypothetical protein